MKHSALSKQHLYCNKKNTILLEEQLTTVKQNAELLWQTTQTVTEHLRLCSVRWLSQDGSHMHYHYPVPRAPLGVQVMKEQEGITLLITVETSLAPTSRFIVFLLKSKRFSLSPQHLPFTPMLLSSHTPAHLLYWKTYC